MRELARPLHGNNAWALDAELRHHPDDQIGPVEADEIHLEQVVDRFEDVANEISAIVIENV